VCLLKKQTARTSQSSVPRFAEDGIHTVRLPVISGLVILAFKGMVTILVREIQLTGCADLKQDVRRSMRMKEVLAVQISGDLQEAIKLALPRNLGSWTSRYVVIR